MKQDGFCMPEYAMKRILFVCSGNVDRSPTAEALLKGRKGIEVKSAGTWEGAETMVTRELISWADTIFAMEEHHKEALKAIDTAAEEKTIVLDVGDHYLRGDPELIELLKRKLSKYFGEI